MLNSKAEQRKCGPWLHGWIGVVFIQCVLYRITLVKVLSTRIVSISSTLSLILQPNPSMSENMCGLVVCSELDGISQQCVTEVQLGFLKCNLQTCVCFLSPTVFDFLNEASLRHEIKISCMLGMLPLEKSLISHSSNYHSDSEQFEKTMKRVCLHGTSHDPSVVSQHISSSSMQQWFNLIKNVLTILQCS